MASPEDRITQIVGLAVSIARAINAKRQADVERYLFQGARPVCEDYAVAAAEAAA